MSSSGIQANPIHSLKIGFADHSSIFSEIVSPYIENYITKMKLFKIRILGFDKVGYSPIVSIIVFLMQKIILICS